MRFEINWFKFGPQDKEDRWTHYVLMDIDGQVPDERLREKLWLPDEVAERISGRKYIWHDYSDLCRELDFHGGITWYSKESEPPEARVIRIGCDYQHYLDIGKVYSLEYVYAQVKESVDSLIRFCGGRVKIRSIGDGKYRYLEEFE